MAGIPFVSNVGSPVAGARTESLNAISRFTRVASDASTKLNTGERIVNAGDDALAFTASRSLRSQISGLTAVQETGQLNVTGLSIASNALNGIADQLNSIKSAVVSAQVADESGQADIQSQIDQALSQIDAAARDAKLGNRGLLDGNSSIKAFQSITSAGQIVNFSVFESGTSISEEQGIQNITVNKLGSGLASRTLDNGDEVFSIRYSVLSANAATRATVSFTGGGTTGDFVEFRVTGKLGSTTFRVASNVTTLAEIGVNKVAAFNALAGETGVQLVSDGGLQFTAVGLGDDDFVKIEITNFANGGGQAANYTFGAGALNPNETGGSIVEYSSAATVVINGEEVKLGGEFGTTARYTSGGNDIEIDFSQNGLSSFGAVGNGTVADFNNQINIAANQGFTGILGASGRQSDSVNFGIGDFTTSSLGSGTKIRIATASDGTALSTINAATDVGAGVLNAYTVADLGSGGGLAVGSGNTADAISTIDRALDQITNEQARLGRLETDFTDAISRAQVQIGNLTAADADVIAVDAATEITNLIQSQLGVSTASSLLSQAGNIEATLFSLLR